MKINQETGLIIWNEKPEKKSFIEKVKFFLLKIKVFYYRKLFIWKLKRAGIWKKLDYFYLNSEIFYKN